MGRSSSTIKIRIICSSLLLPSAGMFAHRGATSAWVLETAGAPGMSHFRQVMFAIGGRSPIVSQLDPIVKEVFAKSRKILPHTAELQRFSRKRGLLQTFTFAASPFVKSI